MAIPVVALAEAEGECCDGLACQEKHTGMTFAGCNMWWPTMRQGDLTPPTMPLPDPADGDQPAPLCGRGTTAGYTRQNLSVSHIMLSYDAWR